MIEDIRASAIHHAKIITAETKIDEARNGPLFEKIGKNRPANPKLASVVVYSNDRTGEIGLFLRQAL